ncbi:hypothetical protein CDV36_015992, partial [Fusarium kuroshium]
MAALHSFAAEAFTLLALGIVVIGFRTYARAKQEGIRNLKIDDYLMLLVIVPYTMEIVLAYTVGARFYGLANNAMTDEQRAALSPSSEEYKWRHNGLSAYQARINVGFVLIAVTYIAIIASIFCGCQPFHNLWQIDPDPGNLCQPASSKLLIFLVVTLNIVTDIYLMAIPIPVLWKANVPKFKKLVLLLLFSGGVFVMVAGILRCVLILK